MKISPPGRLPHFSGVMMPLVLSHFSAGENSRFVIGAGRRAAFDPLGHAGARDQPPAERIDRAKIGAHSFEHDLARDVHHVAVADPLSVHDVAHLHAGTELASLGLRAENTDLRLRQIVENDLAACRSSGRSACSSRTKTECSAPTSSTSHCSAAAISRVASSVMIVTRSSGFTRRQSRIALRAPGCKFRIDGLRYGRGRA